MSIKINIKNPKITLNDIFISENNPRFTLLNNLNDDLKEFISSKGNNYSQNNIFMRLLSTEGDFSDLYRLLNKIYDYGFDNSNEPIYLVKSNNEYFVAEGNRRIMVLKILSNIFEFPNNFDEIKVLYGKYNTYFNENTYNLSKLECFDSADKAEQNFNSCKELIREIKDKYNGKEWLVHTEVIDDSTKIWK